MIALARRNPQWRIDPRADQRVLFIVIFYNNWYQGGNLQIWDFLEALDHCRVAFTCLASYLEYVENIEDLTNDPPISIGQPGQ